MVVYGLEPARSSVANSKVSIVLCTKLRSSRRRRLEYMLRRVKLVTRNGY